MELIDINTPIVFGQTIMYTPDDMRAWMDSLREKKSKLVVEWKDNSMMHVCQVDKVYEYFIKLHADTLTGTEIPITISIADLSTLEVKIKIGGTDLQWLKK